MKPVPQTVLYGEHTYGNGNCFDACLASLLEIPLWMVPPFHQMFARDDRHTRINAWLGRMFNLRLEVCEPGDPEVANLPEFYIVSGVSPRSSLGRHGVIYSNGRLVHDPHYSNDGIVGNPLVFYFLQPARK